MIHISLLPEKLRRVEGTPLPRQLTIYFGVAACSGLIALNALFFFNRIPDKERTLARLKDDVKKESQRATEVDAMEEAIAGIKVRVGAVEQLYRKRIVWAKLLSDLRDIVNRQTLDSGNREFIWFTKLNFLPAKANSVAARPVRGAAAAVKKEPDEFLLLDGYASAPRNNRALEMVHQLLASMQRYVPDRSQKEEVLQELLKTEQRWDQNVAKLKKAGKSLTSEQESVYKGIKDRIEHLSRHSSGPIAQRAFASFFSGDEKHWVSQSVNWEEGIFKQPTGTDSMNVPVNAMRFSFKIGFKPDETPAPKPKGRK